MLISLCPRDWHFSFFNVYKTKMKINSDVRSTTREFVVGVGIIPSWKEAMKTRLESSFPGKEEGNQQQGELWKMWRISPQAYSSNTNNRAVDCIYFLLYREYTTKCSIQALYRML
jgi:hypothetical protein